MKPLLKFILVAFLSVGLAVGAEVVQAEPHDKLVPLLVKIDGWKAETGKGMSMAAGPMKMITAHRSYKKAKKKIDANLMVNSGPPPATQVKEYSMVTGDMSINTKKIDGFWVSSTFDKKKKIGQVFVALGNNKETHAMLAVAFTNMNDKEAVAIAKKFKWRALKKATAKML